MKISHCGIGFIVILLLVFSCKKDQNNGGNTTEKLQLVNVKVGELTLNLQEINKNIPVDKSIIITFNTGVDTSSVKQNIILKAPDSTLVNSVITYTNDYSAIVFTPSQQLNNAANFTLQIKAGLKGSHGETFPTITYTFVTLNGKFTIENITLNEKEFPSPKVLQNIDSKKIAIEISFSQSLNASNYQSSISLTGNAGFFYTLSADNKKVTISNIQSLEGFKHYYLTISNNLTAKNGFLFDGYVNSFFTAVDSTPKFPLISDDALLTLVQKQTFKYFWDFGHPACGLARERNSSGDVVTIGGSGFGVMAMIVGMERGFITRTEGLNRLDKILSFLETCDRYHGAWPHWLNGSTGKTVPFSPKDDGGDLVETSFMIQGLIAMRQYLSSANSNEKLLIDRINTLSGAVEYDWFTQNQNVLYWHWSPNSGWLTNLKLEGYNETLITYVVAATSVTHPIPADAYKIGYTKNGAIKNGNTYFGYKLPLGDTYGGPLFFTHYSFLGLDPRKLKDAFASYWEQNVNQSLINWSYCVSNPKNFVGYSKDSWGLTASDNPWGYNAHSPGNDLGVISPTAAISSIPYTPAQSINAIKNYYYLLGDKLWGDYGFYDAFDVTEGWWANSYLAIDQGPIICMIENYRTSLLWNLFMSAPEVKLGLDKLGFTY